MGKFIVSFNTFKYSVDIIVSKLMYHTIITLLVSKEEVLTIAMNHNQAKELLNKLKVVFDE